MEEDQNVNKKPENQNVNKKPRILVNPLDEDSQAGPVHSQVDQVNVHTVQRYMCEVPGCVEIYVSLSGLLDHERINHGIYRV